MAEAVEQVEIAGFGGHFQVPQHRPGLFKKEPYQRPEDVGSSLPLQRSQGRHHGRIDWFVYLRDCHCMSPAVRHRIGRRASVRQEWRPWLTNCFLFDGILPFRRADRRPANPLIVSTLTGAPGIFSAQFDCWRWNVPAAVCLYR
jgi:hypothetical protein